MLSIQDYNKAKTDMFLNELYHKDNTIKILMKINRLLVKKVKRLERANRKLGGRYGTQMQCRN